MAKRNRKNRRHPHRKHRMKFWEAVRKIGFKRALRYEIRHPRQYPWYPIWFAPMLISIVILAIILYFYNIEYLPIAFYFMEIIVISYMLYRLIKKFDRIRIRGSDLRLFGLKILSGVVSILGLYLIYITLISFPIAFFERAFIGDSLWYEFVTFGYQWHTPYIVPLFLEVFGIGLLIIGAYLFFKFKRIAGHFIWVGRA